MSSWKKILKGNKYDKKPQEREKKKEKVGVGVVESKVEAKNSG